MTSWSGVSSCNECLPAASFPPVVLVLVICESHDWGQVDFALDGPVDNWEQRKFSKFAAYFLPPPTIPFSHPLGSHTTRHSQSLRIARPTNVKKNEKVGTCHLLLCLTLERFNTPDLAPHSHAWPRTFVSKDWRRCCIIYMYHTTCIALKKNWCNSRDRIFNVMVQSFFNCNLSKNIHGWVSYVILDYIFKIDAPWVCNH